MICICVSTIRWNASRKFRTTRTHGLDGQEVGASLFCGPFQGKGGIRENCPCTPCGGSIGNLLKRHLGSKNKSPYPSMKVCSVGETYTDFLLGLESTKTFRFGRQLAQAHLFYHLTTVTRGVVDRRRHCLEFVHSRLEPAALQQPTNLSRNFGFLA